MHTEPHNSTHITDAYGLCSLTSGLNKWTGVLQKEWFGNWQKWPQKSSENSDAGEITKNVKEHPAQNNCSVFPKLKLVFWSTSRSLPTMSQCKFLQEKENLKVGLLWNPAERKLGETLQTGKKGTPQSMEAHTHLCLMLSHPFQRQFTQWSCGFKRGIQARCRGSHL